MGIPLPRFLLHFLYHPRQVSDIPSWLRIANRYPTIELQKNQILSIRWQTLRTLHFQANTHFSMLQLFAKIQKRLKLGLLNKFSRNIHIDLCTLLDLYNILTLESTKPATIIGERNPMELPIALTIPATVPA